MTHVFRIDGSSQRGQALIEFLRTLDFVSSEEDHELDADQIEAIEEARKSLKENGGSPHEEVMSRMKERFPEAFRA